MTALEENMVVAGRFRLNRMIGRGGMGSVWQATHLGLDTECAVKFIEGNFAAAPEAQQRFEREAKAAAQLRSPHVVQIMDNGVWEGRPYIAMELLDGEDLRKRLAKGKMSPSEIASILTQVCRALTKAHALGIVHRDLKPDNIFLVRDDDREIAKVLDFGIAKRADTVDGSNTRTGAMLGTPYYMSPEQAQGVKSVDHRSDLWSLAVIAYQAIVGQLPFQSEALGDLLVKIIVQPAPTPSMVAQVPPGFDAWWAKAVQRDPNGRFQSAKDFSESLTLAVGASQLTDVMDGRQLRAQFAGTGSTASGHTSAMGSAAQLPFGQTPQPPLMPFGQTPSPRFAQTPPASGFQSSGGFPAQHGNTGAPFTTTASEVTQPAVRSWSGMVIGGMAGIVAMVFIGAFALVHFASRAPATPTATAGASMSTTPAATTTSTAVATIAASATTATAATTATTPAATASAAPTTVADSEHASDHQSAHTSSNSGASTAKTGKAPASTKSSKSEDSVEKMGF